MEKSFFEQMGGIYYQNGDYFLPDLLPPESIPVGIWGRRRKYYLKTHREPIYTALLLIGKPIRYSPIMERSNSGQRVNTSFPTITSSTRPEFRISIILHK